MTKAFSRGIISTSKAKGQTTMIQSWYRLEYSYIDAWGYARSADLRFDTPEERNKKLLDIMADENKKLIFYSKSDIFNCWIDTKRA